MKHHRETWYIKLVYDSVLDDYTVSDLPPETRWTYLQLYCLVGKFGEGGTWLRRPADIADRLRCPLAVLGVIEDAGLIFLRSDSVTITRWTIEQIGQSTPRVQKHRAAKVVPIRRSGNVSETVSETPK